MERVEGSRIHTYCHAGILASLGERLERISSGVAALFLDLGGVVGGLADSLDVSWILVHATSC